MKTIFVLTTLAAIVSSTQAATIEITRRAIQAATAETINRTPAPPQDIVLQAGIGEIANGLKLVIPNVQPDDTARIVNYRPDDGLGRIWTITAENAMDFGVDWLALGNKFNGRESFLNFGFATPGGIPNAANPTTPSAIYYESVSLDKIEIKLDYWFWHPVLNTLRAYRIDARIVGSANVIPEPSILALALLGSASLGLTRFPLRACQRKCRSCVFQSDCSTT